MKSKNIFIAVFAVLTPLAFFWGCNKANQPLSPAGVSSLTIRIPANASAKFVGAAQNTILYNISGSGAPVTGSYGPLSAAQITGLISFSITLPGSLSGYDLISLEINNPATQQALAIGASALSGGDIPVTLGAFKTCYTVTTLPPGNAFGFESDTSAFSGVNTANNATGMDVVCNPMQGVTGYELDDPDLANNRIAYMGNGNFVNFLDAPPASAFKISSSSAKGGNSPVAVGDVYCVKMLGGGYAWLQITNVGIAVINGGPGFIFRLNTKLPYCGYEVSTADGVLLAANPTPTAVAAGPGVYTHAVTYAVTGIPYDVAVMGPASGPATTLFIPDNTNSKIYAWDIPSKVTYNVGNQTIHSTNPIGLAIDSVNNLLYSADSGTTLVDQFQIGGGYNSFPASWQGHIGSGLTVSSLPDTQAASGALAKPRYVALDSTGNLFITDTGTGNISNVMEYIGPTIPILAAPSLIYYWAGTIANLDSTQGSNSIGQITASSPQTVIVAASFENQIEFYAPANGSLDGISLTSDNNTLAQPVSFSNPQGVAYSSATTYLYIADTNNNRIVFINASTSAYVNSFGPGFGLNGPTGLKVDNANPPNIYVADSGNHRVVVFSP